MNKVGTDKKLELIRAIRMQNNYDRQLFRSRENFLYSDAPSSRHGELYSLEAAACPVQDVPFQNSVPEKKDESLLKGFRLRFVLAMVLFLAFVYCDIREIAIWEQTTDALFQMIRETGLPMQLNDLIK